MTYAQDKREYDANNWFEVKDNPLSKEGVFHYRGAQIRLPDGTTAPDPDKSYGVYRSAEELSNPEAIASFRLVPWVDDHAMLGAEDMGMTPAEKKGVSGVIGEDVYFKDGTLYGNIKVFSEALARRIEGGKKELSLGYRCEYEHKPGTWNGQPYEYVQRKIRGNHLALVNQGRMGAEVRVLDQADPVERFVFVCDSQMEKTMADTTSTTPEGGGSSGMSLEDVIEQLKQLTVAVAALKHGEEAPEDEGKPVADEEPAVKPEGNPEDAPQDADGNEDDDGPMDKLLTMTEEIFDTVKALTERVEKLEGGNKPATDEADEDKEKQTAAMDAAEVSRTVMARIAERDKAYKQVSPFVGAFDCSAMDAADVASYACKKLGLKPAKGQEQAMVAGYIANRTPDSQKKTVTAAMDGAGASFLDKQLTK